MFQHRDTYFAADSLIGIRAVCETEGDFLYL